MVEAPQDTYLGDGVYASYDGYHVWLAVNHHTNKVVALEAGVMRQLFQYVEDIRAYNSAKSAEAETK